MANIIQSHTPGQLTERGVSMAERLGIHLADEKFTRIYSSDLKRCHDTTLNILKQSSHHVPEKEGYSVEELLVLDEMLRERVSIVLVQFGTFEGSNTCKIEVLGVLTTMFNFSS